MNQTPNPSTPSPAAPPTDTSPRPASGALSKTGGYLSGFTHTLQPYIGCRFGCEYCYVKGLSVHRFHHPPLDWGRYAHPRTGIDRKLKTELRRLDARGDLTATRIFMSSATDPYQGAERRWRLSRRCLETFIETPPALLVVQTRSPLVAEDFSRLQQLGSRCILNVTIETDREDVRQTVTPLCPALESRWKTVACARALGLNVQITVSPCLPFSSPERFGRRLLAQQVPVIVDTFTSGDGSSGKRTARTEVAALYARHGWGDWADEGSARALYAWLHARAGARIGWSQAGFTAAANAIGSR